METTDSKNAGTIFLTRPVAARAGLNNQKMCLFGLISYAKQQKGSVYIPSEIVDFSAKKSVEQEPKRIATSKVFDIPHLKSWLEAENLSQDFPDRELVRWKECFDHCCTTMANPGPEDTAFFERFLKALRSAAPLRELAAQISAFLGANTGTVQLRVEEDWQHHAKKAMENKKGGVFILKPRDIIEKISKSPELSKFDRWLAFCDQNALPWSIDEIKEDVRKTSGVEIIFKSDIAGHFALPDSSIQNAAIDFEIGLLSQAYVGLHQSSFSNMLYRTARLLLGENPNHYLYSTPDTTARRRSEDS